MKSLSSWLWSFASDSSGELHVLWHDGNSLSVDGAKVGVFEEGNEVSLSSLLEGKDGRWLESEVALELLGNFSDESLEGEFSDEEFSRFLVSSDFSEGNCAGSVSVGFLDSAVFGGSLSGSLGTNVLSGSFSTNVLSWSLLCSGHFIFVNTFYWRIYSDQ